MQISFLVKLFLMCVSGFILSLSAPNYGLSIFAWFCLVPLFVVLYTSEDLLEITFCSFLFGFTYNLSYLHWLFSLHPLNWLGLSNSESYIVAISSLIIPSFYNSLYFVIFSLALLFLRLSTSKSSIKNIPILLLTTFFWLIIFNKLGSSKFILGFPWTLIEYSQYKNLFLIQIAEYFGSISIGFLIVFFNLTLANLFIWFFTVEKIGKRYIPKKPGDFGFIISSFLFIVFLIIASNVFGMFAYKQNIQSYSNKSKTISILQGNLPIKATRGKGLDIKFAKKQYSKLLEDNSADLIITPEGSFPTVINEDFQTLNWIKRTSYKKKAGLLVGAYCRKDEELTNCAISLSKNKEKPTYYEKERLVPFGEYVPFYKILPGTLKKFADSIIGEGFTEGKAGKSITSSIGKIGVNICYEVIYPELLQEASLSGAKTFINLSDLSWFSSNCIKQQFLSFAVFRAVENRKPFIIASNNGISAIIDQNGLIKSQAIPNEEGVLIDWINPSNKTTFYSKYGW